MDYRVFLGALAAIIAFIGFIPYVRDIFKGKTKPHAFSWFLWGTLTSIGFLAQISEGGGPGAWVTGASSIVEFSIFFLALKKGKHDFPAIDWMILFGALAAIAVWVVTKNPLWSVILITIIDATAFVPTFRKAFHKPYEETLTEYSLSGVKYIIALFALEAYSVTTLLYPISLIISNWIFCAMVLVRRNK